MFILNPSLEYVLKFLNNVVDSDLIISLPRSCERYTNTEDNVGVHVSQ